MHIYKYVTSLSNPKHHLSSIFYPTFSISNNAQSIIPTPKTLHYPSHLQAAMNHFTKQNQVPVGYPAPPTSYPPTTTDTYSGGPYVTAPPPIGYPTMEGKQQGDDVPIETKSKGDGFLKGCLAGLCCCCCLDMCF